VTHKHPVLIVPGTRISHAPADAEPQDRNRVIMMVDIFSHLMLHRRLSPVMDMLRFVGPFSAIHRKEAVRDFLLSLLVPHLQCSCDSSRQDQAVKIGVPFNVYAYFLSRILPIYLYDEVIALEWAHHHPIYFSPSAIYTGAIGNPSGAFSTTLKNTVIACVLGCAVANRLRINPTYTSIPATIFGNGDDLTVSIPMSECSLIVDPIETLTSTYAKWGFTAKPSKQMVSNTSLLFCKTLFSTDPRLGVMTMAASNNVKKLLWRRPKANVELAKVADYSLDDVSTNITYVNIAKSWIESNRFLKTGVIPGPDSMWPYYTVDFDVFRKLAGTWWGPLGPILIEDVELCRQFYVNRPDLVMETTYGLGFLQTLGECRYHPALSQIFQTILNHITVSWNELFPEAVIESMSLGIPNLDISTRYPLQNQRVYLALCRLSGRRPDRTIELLVEYTYRAVFYKLRTGLGAAAPQDMIDSILGLHFR
jgi:hypothetical protein